jgi:hypothetical protein
LVLSFIAVITKQTLRCTASLLGGIKILNHVEGSPVAIAIKEKLARNNVSTSFFNRSQKWTILFDLRKIVFIWC